MAKSHLHSKNHPPLKIIDRSLMLTLFQMIQGNRGYILAQCRPCLQIQSHSFASTYEFGGKKETQFSLQHMDSHMTKWTVHSLKFYAFKKLMYKKGWLEKHACKMAICRKIKICHIWNQKFHLWIRNIFQAFLLIFTFTSKVSCSFFFVLIW